MNEKGKKNTMINNNCDGNVGNTNDFTEIIVKQKNETKAFEQWEGTVLDYLKKVDENKEIADFASGRVFNMMMQRGTEEVDRSLLTQGYDDLVKYNFFDDKMYGIHEPIHDMMKFLKAASRRTETGKRILLLVGPVSSGKSETVKLIKKGLERYETEKYAIKGCPIHEEPLHAIPDSDRPFWNERLKTKIEGMLCPKCQQNIDENYTKDGVVQWDTIPVEKINISEQRRVCIGTFQPSDPSSQDITELIGRVDTAKLSRFGETDPRGYKFDGELQVANGGMIEYVELLKADIKFHYVLITAAQEQLIKSPGFPQMYIDTMIVGHTNQTEFDSFKADKKNEALHDRMYIVKWPYNLRVDDEIKIYEKMIRESDFRNIHVAPGTLKAAAQFAILTRLTKSGNVSSLIEKMNIYNGEISEEFKKTDVDLKHLIEEGRKNGEGMFGISPRFIINAMNIALGSKESKNCINAIDIIRALRDNFSHHIGIAEEEIENYMNLLIASKDSVSSKYKEFAMKEVNMAFLHAYEEQAESLFERYMINVESFCKKEQIEDSITGEYGGPDEKIMRSIEELIGVPQEGKETFRNGIFVYKSDYLSRNLPFTYNDYDPIREGIEKKLISDLRNVVSLSLTDSSSTNPKSKAKRNKAVRTLLKKGYCEKCANTLLSYIGEALRRDS